MHPMKRILKQSLCGCCVLALAVSVCRAQHYTFTEPAEGLGNLNVDCIAQDRSGYMWVGTENGLFRYDGSQFRKFGPADGLLAYTIQNLFLTGDGALLVGTTSGIYFQTASGSFAAIQPPAGAAQFSQRLGTVFTSVGPDTVVALDRNAAYLLRRSRPDRQPVQWTAEFLRLEDGPARSILAAPGGVLWYGCGSDLCRLLDGKTTHMGAALHLPSDYWRRLLLARDGHLWIRGAAHLGELVPAAVAGQFATCPTTFPAAPTPSPTTRWPSTRKGASSLRRKTNSASGSKDAGAWSLRAMACPNSTSPPCSWTAKARFGSVRSAMG